jgi:hypothetical protein
VAGLIVLALAGVLAYNLATSYFALNGAWYGPLRVQVGPGRGSLEAYIDIATYLNGSLSGSAKFCYKNPLNGSTTSVDLNVSGNRRADKVSLSFALSTSTIGVSALSIALGPELDLYGGFTTSPSNTYVVGIRINGVATAMTLRGGTSALPVALDLKRGEVAQFAAACAELAQLSTAFVLLGTESAGRGW